MSRFHWNLALRNIGPRHMSGDARFSSDTVILPLGGIMSSRLIESSRKAHASQPA
uniref:Uncharacterized protein n=1 Tax=Setaria italica TaxID=4555 RepID=K3Y0T7_SETIT